jgi:anti-sigma regulatory factor (Ser/Thr protein kinase)
MVAKPTLQLTLPGHLRYRSVAVRVVAEACRLVSGANVSDERGLAYEVTAPFDTAFVSAFMEIFNNIAVHAYERKGQGDIDLRAFVEPDRLIVELRDTGGRFEIGDVAVPDVDSLPEGGMGIHIARTLLDELSYIPGTSQAPNLWRLSKRFVSGASLVNEQNVRM